MEALLRQRPPPDRNQPRETSPAAIATGKIVKYREKKAKKGEKAAGNIVKESKAQKKAAKKSIGEVNTQSEPQQVIVTQASEIKTPTLLIPSFISEKKKKASEPVELSKQTPSKVMPVSSSKRKRGEKEKSSKSKKKSRHHHDVKSRGRSRSRGPAKSHGKRGRSLSPSSASEVTSSDSSEVSSDDSSDETDSEEEAYRRRRARSKSNGRHRARSRARSKSRARYSSSDQSGSEMDEEVDENPIFVAFTVPGGKTHMRPIKAGITYPRLLETVYAMSNINQTIPLEISYELNGMTLQLSDEEDLKALLEAAAYTKDRREMVRVKVEKVVGSPKPLPVAAQPPPAPPVISTGAAPSEVKSTVDIEKPSKKRSKKAVDKSKKEEKVIVDNVNRNEIDITKAVNEVTSKDTVSANDSIVSLETSEDVPLAKVIFKSKIDATDSIKGQTKADETASTAIVVSNGEDAAEKPKRKRRSAEEVQAEKTMREARKEATKVEREEKKKEKSALRRMKAKAEKEANNAALASEVKEQSTLLKEQPTISVDIPSQALAPKTIEAPSIDKTDETIVKSNESSATPKTPKKRSSKKANETTEPVADEAKEVADAPVAASEKPSPAKKAKKLSKGEPSTVKEPEKQVVVEAEEPQAVKKALKSSKKSTTVNGDATTAELEEIGPPTSQSIKYTCTICFQKGHSKPYCPVIQGGKESVQQRFDELKAKKQRKTKAENEACKTLQGWLKAEKDHQEQELRFSQKGTLLYSRDQNGGVHAHYASEAERIEDEEEKRYMTNIMNKQLDKMDSSKGQEQRQQSMSSSPGKGRNGIYDITDKIQRDRSRMAAIGSTDPLVMPVLRMGSPAKVNQSSLIEEDQLASSQVMDHENQRGISTVSPTMSESELATSPMLMAEHANGEIQEVTLPLAVDNDASEGHVVKSDGSSDTSDDSSGESDVEQQQEEDEIEEAEAELRQEREKSESIASSANDAEKTKDQHEGEEEEEEIDEIEATPVQMKQSNGPKNSWVASIGSLVGFGGSSQDSQSPAPTFNGKEGITAPPSGQRIQPYQGPPLVMASTPINRRGRPPVGGARLSQLDTSAIKTSYSQPNTPQNMGNSPTKKKAASPSKTKVVEESDSDDSESDSDHETKKIKTMPKSKLAGSTKQKKPRASMLAKMTTS